MKALRGRHGALAGSFLLVLGCLSVLGTAFMLGVVAAHVWPGFPFGLASSAVSARTGKDKGDRSARAPESMPTLTFYQELTAPLTAPPPARPSRPARVERTEPPRADTTERSDVTAAGSAPAAVRDGRFAVQVGAYKAREPAEALRARLAAAGHDAYIVEADGPGAARFRVRVGAFATREAAREAAARLAAERSVPTFITTTR
jgi:cell division protein FtsN